MFDANMRHLPAGHRFICDVWGCKEGTKLYEEGVRKGQVLLATMLEDDSDNPEVMFHLDDNVVANSSTEGLFAYHILYLGTVTEDDKLTDFVYERDLKRAQELMEQKGLV